MDNREEKIIGGDGHVAIHNWEPVDSFGHPKASSEIENEINETRHTMDVLFDTLTEKLHPRAMVDHLMDRFQVPENRKRVQDVFLNAGKRISDSFQENPIPLLLIGVGVAWVLLEKQAVPTGRVEKYRTQDKMNEFAGKASQAVKEKFEDVKEAIKDRREKVRESFSAGKENAAESIQDTARKKEQTAGKMREQFAQTRELGLSWKQRMSDQYSSTGNSIVSLIREKPLAVGFAAAMLGMAAGILFPETKAEERTLGGPAKQASGWAAEKQADITDRGKKVVEETIDTASEKAKEKGLAPEGLSKKENETVTNLTTQSTEKDKKEGLNTPEDVVSPNIENMEINLKEKEDKKSPRKDMPDKSQ